MGASLANNIAAAAGERRGLVPPPLSFLAGLTSLLEPVDRLLNECQDIPIVVARLADPLHDFV